MNARHQLPVTAHSPLPQLLQALRALYPPQCVVHLGIGQGLGDLAEWRNWPELPSAVLIDADPTRLAWARQAQPPSWRVLHATVAASQGQLSYYRASNPQEDGLLPPEQLKPWWPQLNTLGKDTRSAQTLDQLIPTAVAPSSQDQDQAQDQQQTSYTPNSPNTPHIPSHWLLLDCLPAAQLLQGASALLAHTSVVCARTSQASADSPAPLARTGQQALIELLTPLGFVLLAHTETHHPALGYTLLARQPSELLAQVQAHAQANALENLLAQRAEFAEALAAAHTVTAATATANSAPMHPALGDAAHTPTDEREAMATQLVELVTGNKASTTSLNPNVLQAENNALHQRLDLLQDELLRAEGQINLIKDLMLRDQEL